MNNSIRWLLAVALMLAAQAQGYAGLIVDSFQTPLSIQNTGGSGGSAPAAGIFGDSRAYSLQVFNGITQQLDINAGQLALAVTPSVSFGDATLQLTYTDPTPSENITALGLNTLLIEDVVAAGNWTVTVTLKDQLDQTASSSAVTLATNSDLLLDLATFTPNVGTLGNLKEVSLFFNVAGVAPQISFGTVSFTAVPEPASLAVVGLAFLGGSLLRRRSLAKLLSPPVARR